MSGVAFPSFNFSCRVFLAARGAQDGVSFSYSERLSDLRHFGAGAGLRVGLFAASAQLRVWLGGQLLATAHVMDGGSGPLHIAES